jgi:tetratricopeptide (TPR) repeat protein
LPVTAGANLPQRAPNYHPAEDRTPRASALAAFIVSAVALPTLGSSFDLAADTVRQETLPISLPCEPRSRPRTIRLLLADTHQHADVYSLTGVRLRKTGDYATALTFYRKALDFDANHMGAREYPGELYVETGDLSKAREQLAILTKLCPQGCEEREDLEKALARQHRKPTDARETSDGGHSRFGGPACRPTAFGPDLHA